MGMPLCLKDRAWKELLLGFYLLGVSARTEDRRASRWNSSSCQPERPYLMERLSEHLGR